MTDIREIYERVIKPLKPWKNDEDPTIADYEKFADRLVVFSFGLLTGMEINQELMDQIKKLTEEKQ